MPGRLAVDFGTSNTVVAAWDEARREGRTLHIPELGRLYPGPEGISLIPSLIHYGAGQRWIGSQVIEKELEVHPNTYARMKRYILNRTPSPGGGRIPYPQAGQDFLSAVLLFAAQEMEATEEEIALTVPVEAFEHYENWLTGTAEAANLPRVRLIDEPSAAALGYGVNIQPGDVYLIFDFGGGTLDVSVVLIEDETQALLGKRCRVLGKAGSDLGGATIDQWLYEEVLRQNGRSEADEDLYAFNRKLIRECETAKILLSQQEKAVVHLTDPISGVRLQAELTQTQLEALLDRQEAFAEIDRTIRRALAASTERGYTDEHLKAVLMVGGSSLIPSVQRTLKRIFGQERVKLDRPFDAIARGAAAFVAGVDFYDHIQHDYAIRYTNRATGEYDYRLLVKRGTAYPTTIPLARLVVKATYEGQTQLGIAIFEMGQRRPRPQAARMELVFDQAGAARLTRLTEEEEERRALFWMNEAQPTFLNANPPADQGEARFEVTFAVDGNKRLLITARDLKTGKQAYRDHPVIKLA